MGQHPVVVISSTVRDLHVYREQVMDACLRQGMFPKMMEHLPASYADAISASHRLVDEADIYVGVFAHRYGYVPRENNPLQVSITEIEYNRAVERNIPRLIFIFDNNQPLSDFTIDDIDMGESAARLVIFKSRVAKENIVNFFTSPSDLRAHVINSLSKLSPLGLKTLYYIGDIPEPPKVFIAHPYTLLQTRKLIGQKPELNRLTDWVTRPDSEVYKAHILNIVAVGGVGKSALIWKWFNEIAPHEMTPLAGRMWWSFYESDASFDNFVIRALAYITRRPLDLVKQIPANEREDQLLSTLNHEPFLIVLDGLERLLIAYARMDAAHLYDDIIDREKANIAARVRDLPASAAQSFMGEHRLRKTDDPRVGTFLRRLSFLRSARILISTRLYPADLQNNVCEPLPGCKEHFLQGLADDDALELWRAFGVSGSRDSLIPLFKSFGNHPLLIQALASEVARYRRAPGNFEKWRQDHPDFDPFSLPLIQVRSHVLDFALRGLDSKARQILETVAAFRMPVHYDTLAALRVGEKKLCVDEQELDEVLTELEDRGLIGWERHANRYDSHPVVRGVVLNRLDRAAKQSIYEAMQSYFESIPPMDWRKVNKLDDLGPVIGLYHTLCELGRYDDAITLFRNRLKDVFYHRLSGNREITELLERLFEGEQELVPRLTKRADQAFALNRLAVAYKDSGKATEAEKLFSRSNKLYEEEGDVESLISGLGYLAEILERCGRLYESEAVARKGLSECQRIGSSSEKPYLLVRLGMTLGSLGRSAEATEVLSQGLGYAEEMKDLHAQGFISIRYAENMRRSADANDVKPLVESTWELVESVSCERCLNALAHLRGLTAMCLGDFNEADYFLNSALSRASNDHFVIHEIEASVRLAELRRRQGDLSRARELLERVFKMAGESPYVLIHADAFNLLAQIERDAGNITAAIDAATKAYHLAWCDGSPFAYYWGLNAAQRHLQELGVPEPSLSPFNQTNFVQRTEI